MKSSRTFAGAGWSANLLSSFTHGLPGGEYGKNVMAELAAKVQPGGSTDLPDRLRRMREFAHYFTKDEAASWANRTRQDGQPVTWTYVRLVLMVDDHATQLSLLERCVAENLTAAKLTELVQGQKGGKQKGGGRRHDVPESTSDALNKTIELAATFEHGASRSKLVASPTRMKLGAFHDAAEEVRPQLGEDEPKVAKPKRAKAKAGKPKQPPRRQPSGRSMLCG